MFFQKDIETMKREELEDLQLKKLRKMVDYCYNNIPFYHQKLGAAGITSGDKIKTLSDIRYIPVTTKDDIRDNYPFGMLAVPMKKVVRIHASSGTTGKPTVGCYTKADLELWSDIVARVAVSAGARFHWSVGAALRSGKNWMHGDPRFHREHGEADDDVP